MDLSSTKPSKLIGSLSTYKLNCIVYIFQCEDNLWNHQNEKSPPRRPDNSRPRDQRYSWQHHIFNPQPDIPIDPRRHSRQRLLGWFRCNGRLPSAGITTPLLARTKRISLSMRAGRTVNG